MFGAWFFGSRTVALRRAPGEARFGALIGALGADSPVLQGIYDSTVVGGALVTFIGGVIPLAYGLAMLSLVGAWRWIGYAGIVVALANFAAGIAAFAVNFKIGLGALVGIGTCLLWSLAVGIVLALRGVPTAAIE